MPIYLIETDSFFEPLDPVGGWYGPINPEIVVDWIANEKDCNNEFKIVPEIEFPSERHYRRDDWLCVGVRPSRAMPRGLRLYLQPDNASGIEPPGLIDSGVLCWHPDPANAPASVADYTGTSPVVPACTWRFSTDVDSHATSADPLAYDDRDFVLQSSAKYVASDGTRWGLFYGPDNYEGGDPLTFSTLATLSISRRSLGTPVNKERSIVIFDPYVVACPRVNVIVPTDSLGPGSVDDIQLPPHVGVLTTVAEVRGINLVPGNILVMGWNMAGIGVVSAQAQWAAPPITPWVWAFSAGGRPPHLTDVQMAVGQLIEIKATATSFGETDFAFSINGAEQHVERGLPPWQRCDNFYGASNLVPGQLFGTARCSWPA